MMERKIVVEKLRVYEDVDSNTRYSFGQVRTYYIYLRENDILMERHVDNIHNNNSEYWGCDYFIHDSLESIIKQIEEENDIKIDINKIVNSDKYEIDIYNNEYIEY